MSGLFCTFRLSEQLFGVPIRDVKEVSTETAFTAIPQTPPEVRGYVNLRGQVHLVLDLRVLLGMGRAEVTPDSRLVLFKPAVGDAFGVLVDQVGDIVQLAEEQIESAPADDGSRAEGSPERMRGGEFIAGLGKLPGELLIVLQPRKFLEAVERALAV